MSNLRKYIVLCSVAILYSTSAFADLVNLYDFRDERLPSSSKTNSEFEVNYCDSKKMQYYTPPVGLECVKITLSGGRTCYAHCQCSSEIYPFSESECSGDMKRVSGTTFCEDNRGRWYSACRRRYC